MHHFHFYQNNLSVCTVWVLGAVFFFVYRNKSFLYAESLGLVCVFFFFTHHLKKSVGRIRGQIFFSPAFIHTIIINSLNRHGQSCQVQNRNSQFVSREKDQMIGKQKLCCTHFLGIYLFIQSFYRVSRGLYIGEHTYNTDVFVSVFQTQIYNN